MPNKPDLSVLLYNGPTSSTLLDDLTGRIRGLRFGSALHGGYVACAFQIPAAIPRAWSDWLTSRYYFRLAVYEGATLVWEGRKEDVTLTQRGIEALFLGYWANLADFPHLDYSGSPPATVTYNANEHADDIFKDVLAKLPNSQINADQANIARPDQVIATVASPLTFLANMTGQETVITVASWSDSGNKPWYAAIWGDRKPYLTQRDISAVTWHTRLSQLAPGWAFRLSFGDYFSDVYADYLSGGATTFTTIAYDQASRDRYGRRVRALVLERAVPAAVAQQARTTYLEAVKRPGQMASFTIQGQVFDANHAPSPLWRVKAGDVVRIDDLVPATADLHSVTLDGLRTFYVIEAEYNHTANRLKITPDTSPRTISRILQRARLQR